MTKYKNNSNELGEPPGVFWFFTRFWLKKHKILAKVQFLQIEHVPKIQKCTCSEKKSACGMYHRQNIAFKCILDYS